MKLSFSVTDEDGEVWLSAPRPELARLAELTKAAAAGTGLVVSGRGLAELIVRIEHRDLALLAFEPPARLQFNGSPEAVETLAANLLFTAESDSNHEHFDPVAEGGWLDGSSQAIIVMIEDVPTNPGPVS
jgi:hypothetical protein